MPFHREFAKLDGVAARLPDETTIPCGCGTAVDATLLISTKNASGSRDPEMKLSRKSQQWYFGIKAHIGVDAESGLVHSVQGLAGSVNDVVVANALLHGERPTPSETRATKAPTSGPTPEAT